MVVWIPKKGDLLVLDANNWRPLRLPTCKRRLFSSALMAMLGPTLEAGLSPHQAAVRGGSYGDNIRAAYQHLLG